MTDRYRSYSLWFDALPDDLSPRDSLRGAIDVDVAIVGAGYTGLWTAYYLKKADPHLRIAVLEKAIAGAGASGRNGGWVSPIFPVPAARVAKTYGREAALALQRAMLATVDEVGRVAADEGIDAHYAKGGYLCVSTSAAQTDRLRRLVEEQHAWGIAPEDYVWLDAAEAATRIRVAGCRGATFSPVYARVQPARLARGLADVVAKLGVTIYERTPALAVRSGVVPTPAGRVRAEVVVLATEAYTAELPGRRRAMMPMYSHMIGTAPLAADFWDEVGWGRHEVFNDGRHLILYAQRTADDRIAIGGTRAPYHFGSRIAAGFDRDERIFAALECELLRLFPALGDTAVTHRWGGPLGATRDWYATVQYDRGAGLAAAGGYVGDGVATTNLAGRTLADLIVGRDSELVRLPWVGHQSRPWEPEPLRWLAAEGAEWVLERVDGAESRRPRAPRWSPVVDRLRDVIGF